MTAYAGDIVYDGTTIREDLSDLISIMTPADTPLNTMLDEIPVYDVNYDWGIDILDTPTSDQSVIEGFTPTVGAGDEIVRLKGSLSIVENAVGVSGSRRAVTEAGLEDRYNYQIWKKGIKTMKEMEWLMHWGVQEVVPSADSTVRKMAGVGQWIFYLSDTAAADGTLSGDHGVNGVGREETTFNANYRNDPLYQASAADLTRDQLHEDILQEAWKDGMNVDGAILLCGSGIKRVISQFALVYGTANHSVNWNMDATTKEYAETIDVFESDLGKIYINLDRYMDDTTTFDVPSTYNNVASIAHNKIAFLIEPGMFHRTVLRGLHHIPLATTKDATEGFCVAEMGIRCDNPRAGTGGANILA